jgi:hypothetical protein
MTCNFHCLCCLFADKKVKEYEIRAMAAEDELASVRIARDKLQRLLQLSEQSAVELREAPLSGLDASSKLCGSEVEKLRAVFNLFDSAQSGVVSLSGIQALHEKLGEPLTDIEAAEAVRALDRDGSGIVTFDKFLLWWYESHRGGKKSDAYTQRFKLLSAKLQTTDFDSQRVIVQETGERATLQFRVNYYYKQPSGALKPLSPWHDIPLCCVGDMDNGSQLFNFICEIPKWTRAKFEIATGEIFNPIKQDVKNGALRYLRYGDQMFNYGAMPQTWEDPKHISDETGLKGDNDPIGSCFVVFLQSCFGLFHRLIFMTFRCIGAGYSSAQGRRSCSGQSAGHFGVDRRSGNRLEDHCYFYRRPVGGRFE